MEKVWQPQLQTHVRTCTNAHARAHARARERAQARRHARTHGFFKYQEFVVESAEETVLLNIFEKVPRNTVLFSVFLYKVLIFDLWQCYVDAMWDLDAIHHTDGNGNAIFPLTGGSLMLMLMLMALGMPMPIAMGMLMVMGMVGVMAIHPVTCGNAHGNGSARDQWR